MNNRTVTLGMEFVADLTKARAEVDAFFKDIKSRSARIPISTDLAGGTSTTSTPGQTIGGLSAGPVATASPNWSFFASQIGQSVSQAIAGLNSRIAPSSVPGAPSIPSLYGGNLARFNQDTLDFKRFQAQGQIGRQQDDADFREYLSGEQGSGEDDGGGVSGGQSSPGRIASSRSSSGFFGRAGRGIYNRFARVGGIYMAYRGVRGLEHEYTRRRDADEAGQFDGQEAEADVYASQIREDRSSLIESGFRDKAVSLSRRFGIKSIFGYELQTDEERMSQSRAVKAILNSGKATDALNLQSKGLRRSTSMLNSDAIGKGEAGAEFQYQDAQDEAGRMRTSANIVGNSDPGAASTLRMSAKNYEREAKSYYDAQAERFKFLRQEELSDDGSQDEEVSARGNNRPNDAARNAIVYGNKKRLKNLRFSNAPANLIQAEESLAQDRLEGFDKSINREIGLGSRSVAAQIEEGVQRAAGQGWTARMESVRLRAAQEVAALPAEERYGERRNLIFRREQVEEAGLRRDFGNADRDIGQSQYTRRQQVDALLRHDPIGAEAAGIVGGTRAAAQRLKDEQFGPDRIRAEIGLGSSQLDLTRQNFLEGFHATEIGQNFETGSPRQQNDVSTVLKEIAQGQKDLLQALQDLVAN